MTYSNNSNYILYKSNNDNIICYDNCKIILICVLSLLLSISIITNVYTIFHYKVKIKYFKKFIKSLNEYNKDNQKLKQDLINH